MIYPHQNTREIYPCTVLYYGMVDNLYGKGRGGCNSFSRFANYWQIISHRRTTICAALPGRHASGEDNPTMQLVQNGANGAVIDLIRFIFSSNRLRLNETRKKKHFHVWEY